MQTPISSGSTVLSTPSAVRQEPQAGRVVSLVASPMLWYGLAGLAILASLYLFLFGPNENELRRYATAIFVGLWAPMFSILGLRAEVIEMRDETKRSWRTRLF